MVDCAKGDLGICIVLKELDTNYIALENIFEVSKLKSKLNKSQISSPGNEYLAFPVTPPEAKGGKASRTMCS